jgi:hypothetical protein
MKHLCRALALLTLPLLYACSDDSNRRSTAPETPPEPPPVEQAAPAQLRVTHASPDAPDVNVYVNGEAALENVAYKQSSGLINFDEATTLNVEVRGLLPDGSEITVIGPVDIALESGVRTDVVAYDTLFDTAGNINLKASLLAPVTIEEGITDVRVSILHAAPQVGDVDIYVTAPADTLEASTPIDAGFGDAAGPVALMADTDYRIRITADGSSDVVYDSGTLSLPAGTELVLVAVENTFKTSANPVNLLAVGADGANELLDVNTGAAVRVVHNSADTPAVDILVDGTEVLDAVPFPAASGYDIQAPAGTYTVAVAADADNSIVPIELELMLEQAASYTAIAVGSLNDSSLEAVLRVDDRRNLATAARVEVIHGSYLVAAEIPVDIYLTSDGVIADAEPAVSNLAYKASTGQLDLTPGAYWITVTAAGDKSVVAFDTGATVDLSAGLNYTVIARDPSTAEVTGMPLINVTILTD